MRKFPYCPTNASYSEKDSTPEYLSIQLAGGEGRYRRDIIGASCLVDCRWVLRKEEYSYVRMFYRVFKNEMQPFLIDLITEDGSLEEHTAHFIPDTFTLAEKQGNVFTVTAQLEAIPPYRDPQLEADILDMVEAFGADWILWTDRLDYLVNHALPADLKGLDVLL